MMPYHPNMWRENPCVRGIPPCPVPRPPVTPPITPCPIPRPPVPPCPPNPHSHYWQRIPGQYIRPPMNHVKHADKYFYTTLFLDNYFTQPPPPRPNPGLTVYADIISPDIEPISGSPVYWDPDDKTKLIVKHKLQLPVTLEVWDNNNKPIIYAPVLKQSIKSVTIGGCTVQDDTTILVDFTDITQPVYEEKFLIGIKELPEFNITPICNVPSEAIQTLEEFMAVPYHYCKGLAIMFRRNSLQALFDLIADFDETYFHSMDQSTDIKYLVKKSCYKDVHFTTVYTNNLQDAIDLIDVNYYKVQFSWQDYKRYKDGYNDYMEKYGYK